MLLYYPPPMGQIEKLPSFSKENVLATTKNEELVSKGGEEEWDVIAFNSNKKSNLYLRDPIISLPLKISFTQGIIVWLFKNISYSFQSFQSPQNKSIYHVILNQDDLQGFYFTFNENNIITCSSQNNLLYFL